VSGDGNTVYAVTGTDNYTYKSVNGGVSWTRLSEVFDFMPDLVAVSPDDSDKVAVANSDSGAAMVYVSGNGGSTWGSLGTIQETTSDATADTIYDIDVSQTTGGVNYVGVAGVDTDTVANIWWFNMGSTAPSWKETNDKAGFCTSNSTAGSALVAGAIAFSPNFASDRVMTVVTGSTTSVLFQMFSLNTYQWNQAAGFGSGYAVTLVTTTGLTDLLEASISLSPTYLGSDDSERVAFVGLTIDGASADEAASGIYRLKDDDPDSLKTGVNIHSVAFDSTTLAAGREDDVHVYYSDDPLSGDPTFYITTSTKRPGGTGNVELQWAGADLMAGTQGDESAFAVSEDNGKSFNDISLIDTEFTNMEDVGVSGDGSVIYLASNDGTTTATSSVKDLSIWRYDGSWKRVLSMPINDTSTAYAAHMIRVAPDDSDVLYVATKDAKSIHLTKDGGSTKWFTRTSKYNLQDLAVESADVCYVAVDDATTVSKSTNGGFTWGTAKETELQSGHIHMIASISEDNLIVGGTDGFIAYSTDGGTNWTAPTKGLETSAGAMQVTASGLESGDYVYAASLKRGGIVGRWEIGGTAWKNLEAPVSANYTATGIALSEGVLYVQTDYIDGSNAATLRSRSPSASVPLSSYWSTMASSGESFDVTPQALKVSTGSSTTLWSVDTAGTNELFYYKDILTTEGITLVSPATGLKVKMNAVSGNPYDVSLRWDQPPKGQSYTYNVWVAYDSSFRERIVTTSVTTSSSSPNYQVSGASLLPGTTYYWRVRVATDGPVQSSWSEVRSFTVESLGAVAPDILAPVNGATGVGVMPSFSWSPSAGATEYRFVLAANVGLASPIVDVTIKNTGFAMPTELDLGKTYYWSVMAVAPVPGEWSAIANFTVKEKPEEAAPPVVITSVPPPQITITQPAPPPDIVIPPAPQPPAPIAPAYIWAIIIIGAVLVIAVIVLIVRTRRAV
jgi:hypothetical protein